MRLFSRRSARRGPGGGGTVQHAEHDRSAATMQRIWEQRYQATDDPTTFGWYRDSLDRHIVAAIDQAAGPDAVALDIGCGPGTALQALRGRVATAIGLDISYTAVHGARDRVGCTVAVAAAPALPLREASIDLVIDRGCMHALHRATWGAHLAELHRVMRPGALAAMSNHTVGADDLAALLPAGIELLESVTFTEAVGRGRTKEMLGAVLRRT